MRKGIASIIFVSIFSLGKLLLYDQTGGEQVDLSKLYIFTHIFNGLKMGKVFKSST